MSKKKIVAPFRQFEGKRISETHIRLTKSMLLSKNWAELHPTSQRLYLYMKLWSMGNQELTYSKRLGSQYVAPATYSRGIKDLIAHGFIEKTGYASNGGGQRASTFKFSSKWQDDNYYTIYTAKNK